MEIYLARGRVGVHTRRLDRGETVEIDTLRGGVWALQPGVYDVDAGNSDNPTEIIVFEGSARFVGGGVEGTVNAVEALLLGHASNALSVGVAATVEFGGSGDGGPAGMPISAVLEQLLMLANGQT